MKYKIVCMRHKLIQFCISLLLVIGLFAMLVVSVAQTKAINTRNRLLQEHVQELSRALDLVEKELAH